MNKVSGHNKIKLVVGLMSLIAVLGIGFSYAYYRLNKNQDNSNVAGSKCFKLELSNEKNEINLSNMYPISDEEGKKLTPYSFTITNTCDMLAGYTVNIEMLEGTTLASKYLDLMVNNEEIKLLSKYEETSTIIDNSTESRIIAKGTLAYNDSVDYTVRFWMDKDVEDIDSMNKYFASKIVIVATPSTWNPNDAGYNTLHDAILSNEYQTTPEKAIEKINAKGTPDLSQTAPIIKWVEKASDNTTEEIVKPALTTIKSDNQTGELTENDTKIRVYKIKQFDTNLGRYTLSNEEIVDPTELDYENNDYYFYSERLEYNIDTQKLYTASGGGDGTTVYQITGATKANSTTKWNNVNYSSITYKLNLLTLTEIELEVDKSDKGLYKDLDDYGQTYYYRGNVKNNNVYFADFYWQIIRINGDGSIRLLYNGTKRESAGAEKSINTTKFNNSGNKIAYIGYMYGNPDGTTYAEIHGNNVSSNIKNIIDEWYSNNIRYTEFDKYVSYTAGFCGDRSLYFGDGISSNKNTYFSANDRLLKLSATFKCQNINNDLYTTSVSKFGNKALTYPVALITADELVYSGVDLNHLNKKSWSYSSTHYWTMTPSDYFAQQTSSHIIFFSTVGYLNPWNYAELILDVRPVINLKSDVKISGGIGTSNDPFIIDTNN